MADDEAQYKFIPEGEAAARISSRNYYGRGTAFYPNEDQYEGEYEDGIEGTWVENKCIEGRWILPNGNYFEGKFENNKPNGNGQWFFKNGNVITGDFKQEMFEDDVDGETIKKYKLSWATNSSLAISSERINEQERF